MKKKIILICVMAMLAMSLVGCASEEEMLNYDINKLEDQKASLQNEVSALKAEVDALQNEVTDTKIENGTAKYIITFSLKQSHFSLDIGQHLKDAMNEITIQIPVDKEYYDSVRVGERIADDFRVGSLIMSGSFGNWNVTVKNKEIQ